MSSRAQEISSAHWAGGPAALITTATTAAQRAAKPPLSNPCNYEQTPRLCGRGVRSSGVSHANTVERYDSALEEFLGQRDDDASRASHVAESVHVLVLGH